MIILVYRKEVHIFVRRWQESLKSE